MHARWTTSVCALALALGVNAAAQDNGTANSQDNPVLKSRPKDSPSPDQPQYRQVSAPPAAPDAIPEGKRFIIKLKDTLDTHNLQQGKHFKAELREDLVTASGLIVPRGRTVKGPVAPFQPRSTRPPLILPIHHPE